MTTSIIKKSGTLKFESLKTEELRIPAPPAGEGGAEGGAEKEHEKAPGMMSKLDLIVSKGGAQHTKFVKMCSEHGFFRKMDDDMMTLLHQHFQRKTMQVLGSTYKIAGYLSTNY